MRHPTYKHLEAKLRLGAFTLGQWAQITIAGTAAALFGGYLSPLPTQPTIFIAILAAGLPIAISYGAMGMEFSVTQFVVAGWRYWRHPHRFPAGAGKPTDGYRVRVEPRRDDDRHPLASAGATGEPLWDV